MRDENRGWIIANFAISAVIVFLVCFLIYQGVNSDVRSSPYPSDGTGDTPGILPEVGTEEMRCNLNSHPLICLPDDRLAKNKNSIVMESPTYPPVEFDDIWGTLYSSHCSNPPPERYPRPCDGKKSDKCPQGGEGGMFDKRRVQYTCSEYWTCTPFSFQRHYFRSRIEISEQTMAGDSCGKGECWCNPYTKTCTRQVQKTVVLKILCGTASWSAIDNQQLHDNGCAINGNDLFIEPSETGPNNNYGTSACITAFWKQQKSSSGTGQYLCDQHRESGCIDNVNENWDKLPFGLEQIPTSCRNFLNSRGCAIQLYT